MKVLFNALVSVFVCTCLTSALHAQVSDNFSDFDLTINPEWTGNLVDFTTNVEGKLQLNQTVAGQSFLVTSFAETSINNKEWQILVKQTFSGSDNNQSRIYLSFSGSDLSYSGNNGADGQGYFLRLGEGGSLDAVKLFRNDNSSSAGVLIAEGSAGQIATSFEIRIKVVRDDLGNWEIWVAEDGGLVFLPQGSGFDDTYSLATSLGMVCTYTTTNADNFFFDDIYCGEPIIDNDPPEIASASVLDATMVDVFFSEPVEPTSAELAANYLIGASGTITSAMLDDSDPTLVHLELTDELPANTEVLLNVSNISDFSGNVQGADNIAILWFVPQPPEWKSVIFNEVFADPTPSLGLPEAEYLELYNRSEVSFDLAGWQLTNSGLAKVLPSFVLDPGDFVILCAETNVAALSAYGEVISIPSFSALSNDGDNLALYFTDNTLIDVLNYDSDWHTAPDGDEGGISLELINNTLICGVSDNWGSSIASNGGTPGMTNSIANNSPDLTGPALYDFAGYMSEFSLVVYLSEPADEDDLTASNFTLNGGLIIDEIEYFEEELALIITVNPSTPLVFGEGYMLTCNSLFDCQGNESTNLQVSFTFYASPEFGDIIINEIMAAPSSSTPSPNEEYIEIINRSSTSTFDLSALRINNGYFGEQVIIAPGEYLIVTDDDNLGDFIAFPNAVGMNSFPQLTNSGTTVSMTLGGSVLIDKVSYDDTWYHDVDKDEGGWSLELINPNDPCSDASNWTASNHFSGATPGTVNSVFDDSPDVVPPSVGRVLVLDSQTIQVEVIEPIDTLALAPEAFTLFDAAGNELGWEVVALSFPGQRIQAVFSEEFWPGAVFELVITELSDCWGNEAEVAVKFGLPAEPEAGALVINEVLFDPVVGGDDYVEILNISNVVQGLDFWMLANGEGEFWEDIETITTENHIILPGEYLCFTTNPQQLPTQYPFTQTSQLFKIDNMPSYANSDGKVFLISNQFETVDAFTYVEDMQFALIDVVDGVSLERVNPYERADASGNWHSAAQSDNFGTPGYQNSQFLRPEDLSESLSLEPKIFSPNNDGYEDICTINYLFNEPGLVANVSIFDADGREIRRLVHNELLGISGSFVWDGISESREKVAIGIYVIYVEVFDTAGTVKATKLPIVVAAQF